MAQPVVTGARTDGLHPSKQTPDNSPAAGVSSPIPVRFTWVNFHDQAEPETLGEAEKGSSARFDVSKIAPVANACTRHETVVRR